MPTTTETGEPDFNASRAIIKFTAGVPGEAGSGQEKRLVGLTASSHHTHRRSPHLTGSVKILVGGLYVSCLVVSNVKLATLFAG